MTLSGFATLKSVSRSFEALRRPVPISKSQPGSQLKGQASFRPRIHDCEKSSEDSNRSHVTVIVGSFAENPRALTRR